MNQAGAFIRGVIAEGLLPGGSAAQMPPGVASYHAVWRRFHSGDSYYFFMSYPDSRFDYVSPEVTSLLGYAATDFTFSFYQERIHSDDARRVAAYEAEIGRFFRKQHRSGRMAYKYQYDFRIQKGDGSYLRLHNQMLPLRWDASGNISYGLVVHTDIGHLKLSNRMSLSAAALQGSELLSLAPEVPAGESDFSLTARELEILTLLAENKSTDEMAALLHIAPATVSSHRKNIHAKTGTKNVLQLVTTALRKGWL